MNSRRFAGTLLGIGFLALFAIRAQVAVTPRAKVAESEQQKRTQPNLRVDTNVVLVPVSVYDSTNHPITGLEKEHFKLFDDKVEQTVTHFSMDHDAVAIGLLVDTSGSMGPKLRRSRRAASAFFRMANPDDEFFLVEFNDTPRLMVPLTRNMEDIENQLLFTQSRGARRCWMRSCWRCTS